MRAQNFHIFSFIEFSHRTHLKKIIRRLISWWSIAALSSSHCENAATKHLPLLLVTHNWCENYRDNTFLPCNLICDLFYIYWLHINYQRWVARRKIEFYVTAIFLFSLFQLSTLVELALAMIYVILLCVIAFYMKLCVDLIIGASRVSHQLFVVSIILSLRE